MQLAILADDLSGAAETAAALGTGAELFLWPEAPPPGTRISATDLDIRQLSPTQAATRLITALTTLDDTPDTPLIFKKIDSLLRGNVAAEVAALVADDTLVVLTPALPEQGRTVVDGVLFCDGTPLAQTDLWTLEATAPPASVVAALGDVLIRSLALDMVRSGCPGESLTRALGGVASCDAETQEDLTAIVDAGLRAAPRVRFAGSSALARALSSRLALTLLPGTDRVHSGSGGVLHVLGTGSPKAVAQAEHLAGRISLSHHVLSPTVLSHWAAHGPSWIFSASTTWKW